MFGFSHTGADICGFGLEATEPMCRRWTQLGAFYPFSRNHNAYGNRDQDPAAWNQEFTDMAKSVLGARYRLLPYLYTLLSKANSDGDTVVTPLFFEFPDDLQARGIDEQFL